MKHTKQEFCEEICPNFDGHECFKLPHTNHKLKAPSQVSPCLTKLLRFGSTVSAQFNMTKTIIDTLHMVWVSHKSSAGCSQSAVSKHINGMSSGMAKGGNRYTSKIDVRGLQSIIREDSRI
ncbi:hypothetical protein ILYODFUR_037522 [Ilyodon furcidens]|uniref:Uncharacterized protein n=1 Tax=Ilyodon furcidens TaxID=33524 RepID=A0ABV0UM89_9TELE